MQNTKTHPGKILLENFIRPNNLSVNALAIYLHTDANRINEIIKGRRSITADTALRLAHFFGNNPQFWLNLQANYDLYLAESKLQDSIQLIRPFQSLSSGRESKIKPTEL